MPGAPSPCEVGGRFSPETVDFVQRLARARVRSVPPCVHGAAVSAAFAGARPPSWLRARAGRTLPASWPCPPARPQVSMGRRPWSVMCFLTAGSRLPGAAASGEGCPPASEELASVKTAAETSRARRRPLKSPLKTR